MWDYVWRKCFISENWKILLYNTDILSTYLWYLRYIIRNHIAHSIFIHLFHKHQIRTKIKMIFHFHEWIIYISPIITQTTESKTKIIPEILCLYQDAIVVIFLQQKFKIFNIKLQRSMTRCENFTKWFPIFGKRSKQITWYLMGTKKKYGKKFLFRLQWSDIAIA